MSYCAGRSLREVVDGGPVPAREAFSIAFRIAQGLWAAHRRGIVHRDIKPANVLLTDEGDVRIVDFGLALLVGHSRVTTSGVTVGTVAYMSPEQTSDSDVGPNTDIWSLGVTLYEMLTGRLPFRGEINAALVYSIVHEPHTPLLDANSSVPPECARIVDRCLEKDPAKRYQTIEELLEDMVSVARELGWESSIASSTIAPILHDRRRRLLRKRIAVAATAAAVVAAGIVAYAKFWPAPSPYTTEIRLAVLPLDNLIGAENEVLVEGLSEHIARAARWVSRAHPSMWTVPYASVLNADVADPKLADTAFGANRVLTGDVQRFEDAFRINLRLLDPESGRSLHSAALSLDNDRMNEVFDTLLVSLADMVGASAEIHGSPWQCTNPVAARSYFEGMSLVRRSQEGDVERADSVMNVGIQADPSFAALRCAQGGALLAQHRRSRDPAQLAAAIELGRSAHTITPKLTEASILLGDAFARASEPDSAESWYRRGAASEPGLLLAHQRLANFYREQDRLNEAEAELKRAVSFLPDLYLSHRSLGNFCFEHGRFDDSAIEYQTAVALAREDATSLNNLGAVHHRQGDWPAAHELFLRAFKVRPDCESSSNVAVTLYFERRFAEATKYYEFALAYCDTTEHLVWGDLARALYWTPDGKDRATFYYRKALALARGESEANPDDVALMAFVIDYNAMVGNETDARSLIGQIKPLLKDDAGAMYRVGTTCEMLGDREAALDLIGNAIRHGFPIPEVTGDPMLAQLVTDPVFLAMIRSEEAADEAQAAGKP
jgi:tetratricopeptide (TPR) repeat protein/TolB-like protein